MKSTKVLAIFLAIITMAGLGVWYYKHSIASEDSDQMKGGSADHCPYPGTAALLLAAKDSYLADVANFTEETGNYIAPESSDSDVPRVNLIDDYIFGAMETADPTVPHAALSSDAEFLRRIYLDLTGRPPSPQRARAFLASTDPDKRTALIADILRGEQWEQFVERMTLYFGDLLRNRQGMGGSNRNAYYWYIRSFLEESKPYDRVAREVIADIGNPNQITKGNLSFILRGRENPGYNVADQLDYLVIQTSRVFLGVSAECVSCHSGAGHLQDINLWLKDRRRSDLWGFAAFFSGVTGVIGPGFPRPTPPIEGCNLNTDLCENTATLGYDTQVPNQQNGIRPPRRSDERYIQPKYFLTDETVKPGSNYRQELARIITADLQFAKALVNYLWKEFMGVGIVDPPYAFDLARQDPDNPPDPNDPRIPESLRTIQPSHPELLEALAREFQAHNFDVRWVIEQIVKSSAYQLSARWDAKAIGRPWDESYAKYFARHFVRRLSAEQLHDSIVKASGVPGNYRVNLIGTPGTDPLVLNYAVQLPDPTEPNAFQQPVQRDRDLAQAAMNFLNVFERGDRFQNVRPDPARGSLFQIVQLMNGFVPPPNGQPPNPATNFLMPRLRASAGGNVQKLLQDSSLTNEQIIDEMFLSTLTRFPTAAEKSTALRRLDANRERGTEDLMWALINKIDFILY